MASLESTSGYIHKIYYTMMQYFTCVTHETSKELPNKRITLTVEHSPKLPSTRLTGSTWKYTQVKSSPNESESKKQALGTLYV